MATFGHNRRLSFLREIGEWLLRVIMEDDRADWNPNDDVRRGLSVPVRSFAGAARFGCVVLLIAQIEECRELS